MRIRELVRKRMWRAPKRRGLARAACLAAALFACAVLAAGCSTSTGGGGAGTPDSGALFDPDGAIGTDGSDGTDGGDGAAGFDGEPIDTSGDPIGRGTFRDLAGPTRCAGALQVVGGKLAACDGNTLRIGNFGDAPVAAELGAQCLTLAAAGSQAVVATGDGKWHLVGVTGAVSASVTGPAPLDLAVGHGQVYAGLGQQGLAMGPADLSSSPSVHAAAGDARAVLPMGGALLVADGLNGFARVSLDDSGHIPPGSTGCLGPVTSAACLPVQEYTFASAIVPLSDSRFVGVVSGFGILVVDIDGGALGTFGQLAIPKVYGTDAAVTGTSLLLADFATVRLIDLSDPGAPRLVAREEIGVRRAYGMVAMGGAFYTIGVDHVSKLAVDPSVVVPEISLPRRLVQTEILPGFDSGSAGILATNTGRSALVAQKLTFDDPRFSLLDPEDPMTVEPGGLLFWEVRIEGAEPGMGHMTFETNDPDNPSVTITLDVNPALLQTGAPAPDFVAPTFRGHIERLSDHLGEVVHLKLFNAQ